MQETKHKQSCKFFFFWVFIGTLFKKPLHELKRKWKGGGGRDYNRELQKQKTCQRVFIRRRRRSMSSKDRKRAALYERLQRLRAVTNSNAVIVSFHLYIGIRSCLSFQYLSKYYWFRSQSKFR